MQAGARRHIGFRAEDVADAILNIDQLNQTEPWIVGIEKQIDIAVRPGVLPGNRVNRKDNTPRRQEARQDTRMGQRPRLTG